MSHELIVNNQTVEMLENLFFEAGEKKRSLRVFLRNGETYDLSEFSIGQDGGEGFPHCSPTVLNAVKIPAEKPKFFPSGFAIRFFLDEIQIIEDAASKQWIFSSESAETNDNLFR